jgi:hypothetical protein
MIGRASVVLPVLLWPIAWAKVVTAAKDTGGDGQIRANWV